MGLVFLAVGVSKLFTFQEPTTAVMAHGIFPENSIPLLAFVLIVVKVGGRALFFIKRTQGVAGERTV